MLLETQTHAEVKINNIYCNEIKKIALHESDHRIETTINMMSTNLTHVNKIYYNIYQ